MDENNAELLKHYTVCCEILEAMSGKQSVEFLVWRTCDVNFAAVDLISDSPYCAAPSLIPRRHSHMAQ